MAPTFLRIDALDDWLKENEHDLFSRKRIMIPTPHFVVFYNGTEKKITGAGWIYIFCGEGEG